jgi:hypothetical protein
MLRRTGRSGICSTKGTYTEEVLEAFGSEVQDNDPHDMYANHTRFFETKQKPLLSAAPITYMNLIKSDSSCG